MLQLQHFFDLLPTRPVYENEGGHDNVLLTCDICILRLYRRATVDTQTLAFQNYAMI